MSNVKPIPEGYSSVTAYLTHRNCDAAIKFYQKAFGAKELFRLTTPNGGVAHAEIQVGTARIMMADENPTYGNKSPETLSGSPVQFMLYVEDADKAFDKAVTAGATVKRPVSNEFYGDRVGTVVDPFGYQWSIGAHVEDVAPDEMKRRMEKLYSAQSAGAS
jgi:PhnB protein